MTERIDHAAEAVKHIERAHRQQVMDGEFEFTVRDNALIAQAEATLALVEQQKRVADWLESCPRNYQDAPIVETRNGGES